MTVHVKKTRGEMLASIVKERGISIQQITDGLLKAISASFADERQALRARGIVTPPPSKMDVRERSNIAYDWFFIMVGDMGYSVHKALDLLPQAIQAKLRGQDWEPPPADRAWGGKGIIE